jgi:hypothetical protein
MSEIHVQTINNFIDRDTGLVVGKKIHQTRESLRDQFAGQALMGMAISLLWSENIVKPKNSEINAMAEMAYAAADAMLAAREKGAQ